MQIDELDGRVTQLCVERGDYGLEEHGRVIDGVERERRRAVDEIDVDEAEWPSGAREVGGGGGRRRRRRRHLVVC